MGDCIMDLTNVIHTLNALRADAELLSHGLEYGQLSPSLVRSLLPGMKEYLSILETECHGLRIDEPIVITPRVAANIKAMFPRLTDTVCHSLGGHTFGRGSSDEDDIEHERRTR